MPMPMPMPMHVNSSAAPPPHLRLMAGGVGGVGLRLYAYAWPPLGSPSISDSDNNDSGHGRVPQDGRQQQYSDDSVNALSFGFLATAILVSMFLVMAVFERFLRPAAESPPDNDDRDVESQSELGGGKRCSFPSPRMSLYDSGVSVLMPGDDVPSFIAHPAPISHPLERPPWPPHHQQQQNTQCQHLTSNSSWSDPIHLEINVINSCYI